MSFIDFTRIRRENPKLKRVWKVLQGWTASHPKVEAIPVIELVRDLHEKISTAELLDAIDVLVASGVAKKGYRVVDPNMKVLIKPTYETISSVPNVIRDNWNRWIDVTAKDVALVLEAPDS